MLAQSTLLKLELHFGTVMPRVFPERLAWQAPAEAN